MANKIRNIPATEDGPGVLCITHSGRKFNITHNVTKEKFTLWEMLPDEYKKIDSSTNIFELYDKINWRS